MRDERKRDKTDTRRKERTLWKAVICVIQSEDVRYLTGIIFELSRVH